MRATTTMALVLCLAAGAAAAKPHLRDVPEIDGAILAVGIADEIRRNCPEISARLLKAYALVAGLRGRARDLGYSDAEIDAYRKSGAEKARLKRARAAYLERGGAVAGRPEGYCALGRAEIEEGGRVGALLRAD